MDRLKNKGLEWKITNSRSETSSMKMKAHFLLCAWHQAELNLPVKRVRFFYQRPHLARK